MQETLPTTISPANSLTSTKASHGSHNRRVSTAEVNKAVKVVNREVNREVNKALNKEEPNRKEVSPDANRNSRHTTTSAVARAVDNPAVAARAVPVAVARVKAVRAAAAMKIIRTRARANLRPG
jgi:hypothetical protein